MKTFTLLLTLFLAVCTATAQIIHVPGDQPTIQAGINAASDGDTVLVAENTYYENINFNGLAITLASVFLMDGDTSHISNTIINGSQSIDPDMGSTVTFDNGEDTTSILCGFTITGGTGTIIAGTGFKGGGGIFMNGSGGKVVNNYIEYNEVTNDPSAFGAGVLAGAPIAESPWIVIRNNRISYNKVSAVSWAAGAGVEMYYSMILTGNEISYNETNGSSGADGAGVRINGGVHVPIELEIRNNSITYNKAISNTTTTSIVISGGMDIFGDCSGTVSGNNISFNEIGVALGKDSYGTGVMVEQVTDTGFLFENNLVTHNTYSGDICLGGGLCIYQSNGTYQNNVIQNNKGSQGGGVAVAYNSDKKALLLNNTITGNTADYGGGLYMIDAHTVVINSIIWGNTAFEGYSIFNDGDILEVRYSDVEGTSPWAGEGNLNFDPGFLVDGYHLSQQSLLKDAAISSITINGSTYESPLTDIDGNTRLGLNNPPDIGADEIDLYLSSEMTPGGDDGLAMNIYPNPVDDWVTIIVPDFTNNTSVFLFTPTGQQLMEKMISGAKTRLNLSTLPPGVYFLRLQNEKTLEGIKMVKN